MAVRRSLVVLFSCTIMVVACLPQRGLLISEREAIVAAPVWPRPPLRPRIRFVRAIGRPQDFGIERALWQRAWELIAGKQEEWLIRPSGVATLGERISVVDAGAQALWLLDPQAGQFTKIQDAGGQRLISPVAVALGSNDHIYLADSYLSKVFVYDKEGKLVTTISDARFQRPAGLAYDARRDRLYIADSAAHRVWIFSGDGKTIGVIGQRGTDQGEFNFPTHMSVGRDGDLYVTDTLNFRVQILDADGKFAGQFGRHGDSSGDFASPKGVAVDSEGHIYVVDALFDAVQIFDRQGRYLLTFGERGVGPGQFWLPSGLFIDSQNRIYVADSYNQRIQIFEYLGGNEP